MPTYRRAGRDQQRTHAWVSDLENDKTSPSVEQAHQLAKVLERPTKWLIFGNDSGDTAFVATMRALEPQLDDRGRLTVELVAQAQAQMVPPPTPQRRRRAEALSETLPIDGERIDVPERPDELSTSAESP